ncbi:MAG TPA: hypothetical protein VIY49_36655 [Bryobacteraceae bacterium]
MPIFQPELAEKAAGELLTQFPNNTEISHVLLKALALNKLYSTRVLDKDIERLARHIAGLCIDPLLRKGRPGAVDLIWNCDDLNRRYFSFASKYCSWHNPAAYPIYDSYVEECLWRYKRQDGFTEYGREGYRYPDFVRIVSAFRQFYGLTVSFKDLDKFLWSTGGRLLGKRSSVNRATRRA